MKQPTFYRDGTPSEETLEAIRTWRLEDIENLWRFLRNGGDSERTFQLQENDNYILFNTRLHRHNEMLMEALRANQNVWDSLWYDYDGLNFQFAKSQEVASRLKEEAATKLPIQISLKSRPILRLFEFWNECTLFYGDEAGKIIVDGRITDERGNLLMSLAAAGENEFKPVYFADRIETRRVVLCLNTYKRLGKTIPRRLKGFDNYPNDQSRLSEIERRCLRVGERMLKVSPGMIVVYSDDGEAIAKCYWIVSRHKFFIPLQPLRTERINFVCYDLDITREYGRYIVHMDR